MTEFEQMMLYICFGSLSGLMLGSLLIMIKDAIYWLWKKFHKEKESRKQ